MKRVGLTLMILVALTLCLQGCGDKEKGEAAAKWAAFQTEQIDRIQAEYADAELRPYDFKQKMLEVEDLPYRFKGLISFKMGSIFQEQSYAFVEGSWTPVKYVGPKDKKAEKERRQKIESVEERISELAKEIKKEEKELKNYKERLARLEAKTTELETLRAELKELKGDM